MQARTREDLLFLPTPKFQARVATIFSGRQLTITVGMQITYNSGHIHSLLLGLESRHSSSWLQNATVKQSQHLQLTEESRGENVHVV